jgi:hypothetical protein
MMQNIAQLFKYIECLAKNATFFVNMESTSSVIMSGVQLPTFPMVSDDVFRLVEAAATTAPTSTDEFGEYFAVSLTQVLPAELVPADSIIVIPLSVPVEDGILDFTSRLPKNLRHLGHMGAVWATLWAQWTDH